MKRIYMILALLAGLTSGQGIAQTKTSTVQSSFSNQLQSPEVPERQKAFGALLRSPEVLKGPSGSDLVVDLLERETNLIESTLLASNSRVGVSQKYGEGYSEYYAQVLDTAVAVGNRLNPHVIEVLARASYNSDSGFAIGLAKEYGVQISTVIIELAQSPLSSRRMQAVEMLGTILQECKTLPVPVERRIRLTLLNAISDQGDGVRLQAVITLGEVGELSDIGLLNQVRQNDKGIVLPDKSRRFFVREAADKAILKIRERASTR